MKKCPFCGAVIEEDARFCLYCMKELEEKAVIDGKQSFLQTYKTRLIFLCTAALLLLVVLLLISRGPDSGQTTVSDGASSDAEQQQANTSSVSALESSDGSSGAGYGESAPVSNAESSDGSPAESSHTGNAVGADEPSKESSHTGNAESSGGSSEESNSVSNAENSDESPEESSHASASESPGEPSGGSSHIESSENTSTEEPTSSDPPAESTDPPPVQLPAEQVQYTYRDAQFYNLIDAADGANKGLLAQNAVVITGVETAAKSGVYVIPDQIDGKKVVAMMEGAFSDPEICSTVKKIVFPASIHSVWENFQYCSNLTDLYFSGKSVVVDLYTFSLIPNKQQLTVHGASDCVCYYGSIGKTTLKERAAQFGIRFQTWNGGNDF